MGDMVCIGIKALRSVGMGVTLASLRPEEPLLGGLMAGWEKGCVWGGWMSGAVCMGTDEWVGRWAEGYVWGWLEGGVDGWME